MSIDPHAATPLFPEHVKPLHELDDVWRAPSAGERLLRVRSAGLRFRERLVASGTVTGVRTFDVTDLPYPTTFAFGGAASSPVPYIVMTNRCNLVQFETERGERRTLLFNPTDAQRSAKTPFFVELRARMGSYVSTRLMEALRKPTVVERLASAGVRPEDVDYIAFDHLHTQDARGLLGTSRDDDGQPVSAALPRAKLLVWRPELDLLRELHPLQRLWYLPGCVGGVPADRIVACDGDVLLGRGVALVRTPGHTAGNWSLAINTESGVWAVSENGVSCDSYAPEASRMPGLARFAKRGQVEVILNSNTLEGRYDQYTSMVLEKTIVDRCRENPDFCQHFASSELSGTKLTPGLSPTYRHGGIESGTIRRSG